jgi:hypothetical protein
MGLELGGFQRLEPTAQVGGDQLSGRVISHRLVDERISHV